MMQPLDVDAVTFRKTDGEAQDCLFVRAGEWECGLDDLGTLTIEARLGGRIETTTTMVQLNSDGCRADSQFVELVFD